MNPTEILALLARQAERELTPAPTYIYKPRNDGSGVGLKLNLRVTPIYGEKDGVVFLDRKATQKESGTFLDLAPQDGKTEDEKNAKFGWDSKDLITTKLGLADLLNMLTTLREIRARGRGVPTPLRSKNETDAAKQATTLALFHKFGTSSTALNWQFAADGSSLSVSKSRTQRKSVNLTLMDESQIERYLSNALDVWMRFGLR